MQVNKNSLSSEASARLPWSQATTTIGTTELVENRPSRCRCRCFCRQQNHCWKSTPALGSAGDGRNFNRQTSGWRLLLFEFQGKWQKNNFVFFKILTFKQKLGLPFMNMIIFMILLDTKVWNPNHWEFPGRNRQLAASLGGDFEFKLVTSYWWLRQLDILPDTCQYNVDKDTFFVLSFLGGWEHWNHQLENSSKQWKTCKCPGTKKQDKNHQLENSLKQRILRLLLQLKGRCLLYLMKHGKSGPSSISHGPEGKTNSG